MQVRTRPKNAPRKVTSPFLETPPTMKLMDDVSRATTIRATRIGSYPLRKQGIRTFQSINPEKKNDKRALAPVMPPTVIRNRPKSAVSSSSTPMR